MFLIVTPILQSLIPRSIFNKKKSVVVGLPFNKMSTHVVPRVDPSVAQGITTPPSSPTEERRGLLGGGLRDRHNTDDLSTLIQRVAGYSASAFASMALTFALTILPLSQVGSVLGTDKLNGASVGLFTLYLFAQYPLMGMGPNHEGSHRAPRTGERRPSGRVGGHLRITSRKGPHHSR